MKKVSEYRQHAEECRQLAKQITNPMHLRQSEEMAEAWEMGAQQRERQLNTSKTFEEPEDDMP